MARPATVTLNLPGMLAEAVGAVRIPLVASTLRAALAAAYQLHPALQHHLCKSEGTFRPHILCYLNDRPLREMKSLDVSLRDGDEIRILQAISGG